LPAALECAGRAVADSGTEGVTLAQAVGITIIEAITIAQAVPFAEAEAIAIPVIEA